MKKLKNIWWLIASIILLFSSVGLIYISKTNKTKVIEKINTEENDTTPQPSPTSTPTSLPSSAPGEKNETLQALGTGKIFMEGQTTDFSVNIPLNGGAISGSASGFCVGSISGAFDSATNFVHGELSGTCSGIESTGSFTGEIILSTKEGSGTFQGTGGGISKSGNWILNIRE